MLLCIDLGGMQCVQAVSGGEDGCVKTWAIRGNALVLTQAIHISHSAIGAQSTLCICFGIDLGSALLIPFI